MFLNDLIHTIHLASVLCDIQVARVRVSGSGSACVYPVLRSASQRRTSNLLIDAYRHFLVVLTIRNNIVTLP